MRTIFYEVVYESIQRLCHVYDVCKLQFCFCPKMMMITFPILDDNPPQHTPALEPFHYTW